MQHRVKNMAPSCKALPAVVTLDLFTPVPVPLPPKPAAASNTEGKSKEGSPGTPEADRTPTGANGGAEPSTNNHKKDKKKRQEEKKGGSGECERGSTASGGSGRRSRWGRWSQGGCRRFVCRGSSSFHGRARRSAGRSVEARRSRGRHREGVGAPGLGQALLRGDRPWRGMWVGGFGRLATLSTRLNRGTWVSPCRQGGGFPAVRRYPPSSKVLPRDTPSVGAESVSSFRQGCGLLWLCRWTGFVLPACRQGYGLLWLCRWTGFVHIGGNISSC